MEFIYGKYFMTGTVFRSDRISSVYIVSKLLVCCWLVTLFQISKAVRVLECKSVRVWVLGFHRIYNFMNFLVQIDLENIVVAVVLADFNSLIIFYFMHSITIFFIDIAVYIRIDCIIHMMI